MTVLPLAIPRREPDGTISGCIVHVDNFGNLITNIGRDDLPGTYPGITVEVKKEVIRGLEETYGTGEGLLALIGSSAYVEIALKEGSAAAHLNAGVGDEVRVGGTAG